MPVASTAPGQRISLFDARRLGWPPFRTWMYGRSPPFRLWKKELKKRNLSLPIAKPSARLGTQVDTVFKLRLHPHIVSRRVADGLEPALARRARRDLLGGLFPDPFGP